MALHTYQNNNVQAVGIAQRTPDLQTKSYRILAPGASIVLENDPKLARPFNPATRAWLPYNVLTDLGVFNPSLTETDDETTWPAGP